MKVPPNRVMLRRRRERLRRFEGRGGRNPASFQQRTLGGQLVIRDDPAEAELGGHLGDTGAVALVRVPNRFKLDWIRAQYAGKIAAMADDFARRPQGRHPLEIIPFFQRFPPSPLRSSAHAA